MATDYKFDYDDGIALTIQIHKSKMKEDTGDLKKPLTKKQLVNAVIREFKKEAQNINFADIKQVGVYNLSFKLWVVRGGE